MTAVLRGSSWGHPRGHAPMLATAREYEIASHGSVRIEWVPRSLKEFGMESVDSLARRFDLIVIDHPHVGMMAESGWVVPFDDLVDESTLDRLALASPGHSHDSYRYGSKQWALANDAACQTSAWRADLLGEAPRTWAEVRELSASGRVLWPLGDVDAAASLMTLVAAAGHPCGEREGTLVDGGAWRFALETMTFVADRSDPSCLTMNPIDALEALACSDRFVYSPLLFCYVNYSRPDSAGAKVTFGNIPAVADDGPPPRGSLLGGAGLAVSAHSRATDQAVEYALYVADPETQRGVYFDAGGQPAHGAAWDDPDLDIRSGGFFSGVRATLEGSWTRPRHPSFVEFQNRMFELCADWRSRATEPDRFLGELDLLYLESLGRAGGEA